LSDKFSTLAAFNVLDPAAAARAILSCNGSLAWAEGVAALRPFHSADQLCAASDKVWLALSHKAWQHAFDSHPRIGGQQAKAATAASLAMSAHEQSAAQLTEETQQQLAAANREYEEKFGRIFLVCASGKTAAEMLAILRAPRSRRAAAPDHPAPPAQMAQHSIVNSSHRAVAFLVCHSRRGSASAFAL
jgi:2-oxo-4-hydroxy-4-carboxy-5-ureidoimidazoline decarboxylase